jgi:hypothetical protein
MRANYAAWAEFDEVSVPSREKMLAALKMINGYVAE